MSSEKLEPEGRPASAAGVPRERFRRDVLIPLPGPTWLVITAAFPLSEAEWAQMMAVFEAMKPGLVESGR